MNSLLRMMKFLLVISLYGSVYPQDLRYVEYESDWLSPAFHKAKRDSIRAQIGTDAIAIFYSAPERVRNNDVNYRYRQDDNFFYLTGFRESGSVLILLPSGGSFKSIGDTTASQTNEVLLVQPRIPMFERWTGRRYGREGAKKILGLAYAMPATQLKAVLGTIISLKPKVVFVPPISQDVSRAQASIVQPIKAMIDSLKSQDSTVQIKDPAPFLRRMRATKSAEEIALITKACEVSALAHKQAMMSCTPGMREFELQAVYEYVYTKMGLEYTAYPCIIGSGENSVVLHYETNRREMKQGDIIVADCGGEYHCYAADITRTYPVSGKFSQEQKQIYTVVLNAQKASIDMMRPGVSMADVTKKATEIIEEGLFKLGIIKSKGGTEVGKYFNHGLGHGVGLDVHDVGAPVLQPGAVFTIEPGIYIPEESQGVAQRYWNIGVRIEDTILITADGHKVLSKDAPKEIREIEAVMAKKGVGNLPLN
jgi:Xaa-Pro aminopeptidase